MGGSGVLGEIKKFFMVVWLCILGGRSDFSLDFKGFISLVEVFGCYFVDFGSYRGGFWWYGYI